MEKWVTWDRIISSDVGLWKPALRIQNRTRISTPQLYMTTKHVLKLKQFTGLLPLKNLDYKFENHAMQLYKAMTRRYGIKLAPWFQ